MQIEAATERDARSIAEVHVASWQAAYPGIVPAAHLASLSIDDREASWRAALAGGEPEVLVARVDGRVAGFIACGRCRDDQAPAEFGEVWALYVAAPQWSSGVGRALWLAGLQRLRARSFSVVTLWVLARNDRGRRFYEAAGFRVDPGSSKMFSLGGAELEELRLVHRDESRPNPGGPMSHKIVQVGVAAQIGAYCDAVEVQPNSRWLFTSGTPGLALDGRLPGDIAGQAEVAWTHIVAMLARADMTVRDLVKVTHYLLRAEDIPAYVKVRSKFLGDCRCASMLLVVPALVRPEFLLEVEAYAARP
jgi:enamine deaminase RidA (YjgF/YER057c/UK114 family)/ribosomal protein S18 acetylase RimI-like enzyme